MDGWQQVLEILALIGLIFFLGGWVLPRMGKSFS